MFAESKKGISRRAEILYTELLLWWGIRGGTKKLSLINMRKKEEIFLPAFM